MTAAGFERELEIMRTGDVMRLRGAGAGQEAEKGAGGGGAKAGQGGQGVKLRTAEERRMMSCAWIRKVERELAARARAEGKYEAYFMDEEEWDEKSRRVMNALADFERPLYKLPKKERLALADDIADVIRGLTVPEWVVMRVISKHHRRVARTSDAEREAAFAKAHAEQIAAEKAADAAAAAEQGQQVGELDLSPGITFLDSQLPYDPAGTQDDAAWPPPLESAITPPWLGFDEWDWDARTWGPEMERDREPVSSEHDAELTDDRLRQLVLNEKFLLAVQASDFEEVERLLAAGAQVNFYDAEFSKCCALHSAAAQV